ncbi:hypothetical protein SEA_MINECRAFTSTEVE_62 [Gordonia phage MinecraftSteve]|uniref:Uncharacterized protein n=1 Tax=Gordonia phage Waits TaxID=2108120 RepID=A0A2P1JSI7_9CAUD|nr:nucleotide kinase [Gordonia phage Rosalind]YP_009624577.1 nucleotide kinase [Gordonia phage Waits]ANA87093.1 hypothetical protein PBI_ROSALIND_60 [Gordonia phage Rosalind]AVO22091.1 hypothetical protein PBI_WAITS_62 [Gordonia phage Waits]QFP95126.1 hypothetical protein SEA_MINECRAFTSTEVE_62 [Gordonia phage MinecraftSteve]
MTETRVHVDHYASTEIETIDFIADKLGPEGFKAYVLGNILKYAARAQFKGVFDDDLEKIRNYSVILQEHQAKLAGEIWDAAAAEPRTFEHPYESELGTKFTRAEDNSAFPPYWVRFDGTQARFYYGSGRPGAVWPLDDIQKYGPFKEVV